MNIIALLGSIFCLAITFITDDAWAKGWGSGIAFCLFTDFIFSLLK